MSDGAFKAKLKKLYIKDETSSAWRGVKQGDCVVSSTTGERMTLAYPPVYISNREVFLLVWRDADEWILPTEERE